MRRTDVAPGNLLFPAPASYTTSSQDYHNWCGALDEGDLFESFGICGNGGEAGMFGGLSDDGDYVSRRCAAAPEGVMRRDGYGCAGGGHRGSSTGL
jgi:hypothetical protein